jgi:hypothetical protein
VDNIPKDGVKEHHILLEMVVVEELRVGWLYGRGLKVSAR